MWRNIQKLTIAIALRIIHAALVELRGMDSRVRREFDRMPEGMGYALSTGFRAPELEVVWQGGSLRRCRSGESHACCRLAIKSLPLSFRLFTGRMSVAQGYAWHAFSVSGDVADVMKLVRLIDVAEAYLFPRFMTRRILTDVPPLQASPLRVYGRMACGFLTNRYGIGKQGRSEAGGSL